MQFARTLLFLGSIFSVVVFSRGDGIADETKTRPILPLKEVGVEKYQPELVVNVEDDETGEDGDLASISVKLGNQPIADVVLTARSLKPGEGKVVNREVFFNRENWNSFQTVTVQGIDDDRVDGLQSYLVELKTDSKGDFAYHRLDARQVHLKNTDNDKAGFTYKTIRKNSSENGGKALYSLRLTSRPSSTVTIPIVSGDKGEGIPEPNSISITPDNWSKDHLIHVKGIDDRIKDGVAAYKVHHGKVKSSDPNYNGLTPRSLTFSNIDNDTADFILSAKEVVVYEDGRDAHVSIRLLSQPTQPVHLSVLSSNMNEASVKPGVLTFNSKNWTQNQSLRVIPRDDRIDDGDKTLYLKITPENSKDPVFANLPIKTVKVINKDDDKARLVINPLKPITSEAGEEGKIGIRLDSQPMSDVRLEFQVSNRNEAKLLLGSIHFNEQDWFQEKWVRVVGLDDEKIDGDQAYAVTISSQHSKDRKYRKLKPEVINMTNLDDEKVGFSILKAEDYTNEDGRELEISIALNAKPASEVILNLWCDNESEAMVNPSKLIFTQQNWKKPQKLLVTGVADGVVDGDKPFQIRSSVKTEDIKFAGVSPTIPLLNKDTNRYEISAKQIQKETDEFGKTASVEISLKAKPRQNLYLSIISTDKTEGKPKQPKITFTPENWNIPQIVNISGVADDLKDGDQSYSVQIEANPLGKSEFREAPVVSIPFVNRDNDSRGIIVREINQEATEEGDVASFSIKLTSEPTSSVVFIFSCSDSTECEMVNYHAAFFPDNWNQEQVVTIKGVKDYLLDGDQPFTVSSLGAISRDVNYAKYPFQPLNFINVDRDKVGFVVDEINDKTSELGTPASFRVKLSSIPRSTVRLSIKSDDPSEGEIFPQNLELDKSNWESGVKVSVQGVEDHVKDGDQSFNIIFEPAVSADQQYSGLYPGSLPIINRDSKRFSIGLMTAQVQFHEEINESVDDGMATGIGGSYTFTNSFDVEISYLQATNTGSRTINRYNLNNPMEYTLNYNLISLGGKYEFFSAGIDVYSKAGLDVSMWELTTANTLTRAQEANSGSSTGVYGGVGSEVIVFGRVIVTLDGSYHYLTRGLSNTQFTLSIKYPI